MDYSGATSTIIYKITDISNSSSTLAEIITTSTSANVVINETNRNYKFSIQSFDKDRLSSSKIEQEIFIPKVNLIIAQQLSREFIETGAISNAQFEQYLGNGFIGSPKDITFHAKFDWKPEYIQVNFWESDNPDYSNQKLISINTCDSNIFRNHYCYIDITTGTDKDYVIPIEQPFIFNPEKYYKASFEAHQANYSIYFYGSSGSDLYCCGFVKKTMEAGVKFQPML